MDTVNALYVRHPLGPEFAKWVEMTVTYRMQLENATPEHVPNRGRLTRLAKLVRKLPNRRQTTRLTLTALGQTIFRLSS